MMSCVLVTTTATGRLLFTMIGAIAAFEREMMLERQREGIQKAQSESRYTGRRPTIDAGEVARLKAEGLGASEIARRLGIGRASMYRLHMKGGSLSTISRL
jgi:DNA invertase Pin-like site-specific DNA recombinase